VQSPNPRWRIWGPVECPTFVYEQRQSSIDNEEPSPKQPLTGNSAYPTSLRIDRIQTSSVRWVEEGTAFPSGGTSRYESGSFSDVRHADSSRDRRGIQRLRWRSSTRSSIIAAITVRHRRGLDLPACATYARIGPCKVARALSNWAHPGDGGLAPARIIVCRAPGNIIYGGTIGPDLAATGLGFARGTPDGLLTAA